MLNCYMTNMLQNNCCIQEWLQKVLHPNCNFSWMLNTIWFLIEHLEAKRLKKLNLWNMESYLQQFAMSHFQSDNFSSTTCVTLMPLLYKYKITVKEHTQVEGNATLFLTKCYMRAAGTQTKGQRNHDSRGSCICKNAILTQKINTFFF